VLVVVFPSLSTDTTCCACPVAAACFFAASIALSCADSHPASIASPSASAPPNPAVRKPIPLFKLIIASLFLVQRSRPCSAELLFVVVATGSSIRPGEQAKPITS
jgi:hypothetical protein